MQVKDQPVEKSAPNARHPITNRPNGLTAREGCDKTLRLLAEVVRIQVSSKPNSVQ